MKLTIAGWFPTMPVAYRVTEDENGDQVKTAIGVTDRDGIHVTPGSVMTILDGYATETWVTTQINNTIGTINSALDEINGEVV